MSNRYLDARGKEGWGDKERNDAWKSAIEAQSYNALQSVSTLKHLITQRGFMTISSRMDLRSARVRMEVALEELKAIEASEDERLEAAKEAV